MDVTDIPSATVHGDSDENRQEKPQNSQGHHNQYASEYCNNPLAKREVQTARPCAIIGPDRVIQQQPKRVSVVWPPAQDDTPYYSVPQNYHHYSAEHLYPPRNISPRQTFQENMSRILVPSGSSSKITSEVGSQVTVPGSFSDEGNIYIPKHFNQNLPPTKYCEIPYVVNQVNEHRPHATKIGDIYVTKNDTLPSMMAPVPPHPNLSARNWQQVPVPQYQANYPAPSLHRYADYQHCPPPMYRPVKQGYKKINDETSPTYIGESIYRNSDLRFQPYPTVKDKYGQPRYDYAYNISNQFSPNYNTSQTIDYPKTVMRQPVQYPQNLHSRSVELSADCLHKVSTSRQPSQPTHHNMPYQMNETISVKHIPGEHLYPMQSKVYGYSGDSSGPYVNSVKGFENSRVYLDYNQRVKNIAHSDSFVGDPTLANYHKTQAPIYNYPVVNTNGQRALPPFNVNYKMYETLGNARHIPEYNIPYKTQDLRQNTYNPLARIPAQFSPNIISPTDSNTSLESTHQVAQEDCGYVSQCSTTSGKSVEYQHKFYSNCDRKGNKLMDNKLPVTPAFYNMSPNNRPAPEYSHPHSYQTNYSLTEQNKQSKQVRDVRQFLQMYNPHEEFEDAIPHPNQEALNCEKLKVGSSVSGNVTAAVSGQNQLYVLDRVNVSSEELKKYDHIQKVNKLPDNIKGYNSVELLDQFEEAIRTSESRDTFEADKLPNILTVTDNEGVNIISHNTSSYNYTRPISPLDVEAKISQSIIHKEVGCNFEIKPCSPVQPPNLPILSTSPKFGDVLGSDVFNNTHQPKDTAPEECTQVQIDTKSKLREKRRAKIGNTHTPSKRPKSTPLHAYDTIEGVASNPYISNDSDQIQPECQSSLPQLDSDIDMVGNVITRNKNDAIRDCIGASYMEGQSKIQYNNGQYNPNALIHPYVDQNEPINSKEIMKSPLACVVNNSPLASPLNSLKMDEKNVSKLSKYRKMKKIESPLSEMLMPSGNTIEYCSNSPLNLECSELKQNNNRSDETILNRISDRPLPYGLVNSVINSITDGKIESVTFTNTVEQNPDSNNQKSMKNIYPLQCPNNERLKHEDNSVKTSSFQRKKLGSFAEEPHGSERIRSCDFVEQSNSSIQDIDQKLCSIQLIDNDNHTSSDYKSKPFVDVYDSFSAANIGQANMSEQRNKFDLKTIVSPKRSKTTEDEIDYEMIKKTRQDTEERNDSTTGDIKNVVVRNYVIENDSTKEVNDIGTETGYMLHKTNCKDGLIDEYVKQLSPNPTELTKIASSAIKEISPPEEQDIEVNKDSLQDTLHIDETSISGEKNHGVVVSPNDEPVISEEESSEDTQSENISDTKKMKVNGDIENNALQEFSDIEIKSICDENKTLLPNSTEPTTLINSPSNQEISDFRGSDLESSKDDHSVGNIQKTEISSKNVNHTSEKSMITEFECRNIPHSGDLHRPEDNESSILDKISDSDMSSVAETNGALSPKSKKLSTLSDLPVNKGISYYKEKDLNISKYNSNKSHIVEKKLISEGMHHGIRVSPIGTPDTSEKMLSIDSQCQNISNSEHLNVSEYVVSDSRMQLADNGINSLKHEKVTSILHSSINEQIIHTEQRDISKENTERNILMKDSDTALNSDCETGETLSKKSIVLSPFLDLPVNQVISHFVCETSKETIPEDIDHSVVDLSESTTGATEECENISYSDNLNLSEVFESNPHLVVTDTVMFPVYEKNDTSSLKSGELTLLSDAPVNPEISYPIESNISEYNLNNTHSIDKAIIYEKKLSVVVPLISTTETSETKLSTKLKCEEIPSFKKKCSTDIERNTSIKVANTAINYSCATDDSINQGMSHPEKKEVKVSEGSPISVHHIDDTIIPEEIHHRVVDLSKSKTDKTSRKLTSSEWKREDISSSDSSNSSDIEIDASVDVADTANKYVCKTDETLPPVNQEMEYSEEKDLHFHEDNPNCSHKEILLPVDKDNPKNNNNIDDTIVSEEIHHKVVVSSESKNETSQKLFHTESECKDIAHLDNLNSTGIERSTFVEEADTTMEHVCGTDDILPLVNQEISHSQEKDQNVTEDNHRSNRTIDDNINCEKNHYGAPVSSQSKPECKDILGLGNFHSTGVASYTPMEVFDIGIHSVRNIDNEFSLNSNVGNSPEDVPIDETISHFEEKDADTPEDSPHNRDLENIEKTMISDEINHTVSDSLESICDESEKSHLEHLDVSQDFVSNTLIKDADIDNGSACETDCTLLLISRVPSPIISVANRHESLVCLKRILHEDILNIDDTKLSGDIQRNSPSEVTDTQIDYVCETDKNGTELKPQTSPIHKLTDEQIENEVEDIVFTGSTNEIHDTAENSENSSESVAITANHDEVCISLVSKLTSTKSNENIHCAPSEKKNDHKKSSVTKDLDSEAGEQKYVEHANVEGIKNNSNNITTPKLVENYDSPISEALNVDEDESTLSHNNVSNPYNGEQSSIESNDNFTLKKFENNYVKTDNNSVKVNVVLEETIEKNACDQHSLIEGRDTPILINSNDEKDGDNSIGNQTIDYHSNCDRADPILVQKCDNPKSELLDVGEISVGINLTPYENIIHHDKEEAPKLVGEYSSKSNEISYVDGKHESVPLQHLEYGKEEPEETTEINNCDTLLPILVANYKSPISNEFNLEKDGNIDVRVNPTSDVATEIGDNKDNTNIVAGKVEKCNSKTNEELYDEMGKDASLREKIKSNDGTIVNNESDLPVLVEFYDSPLTEELNEDENQKDHVLVDNSNFDECENISVSGEITCDDNIMVDEYNSQKSREQSPDNVEDVPLVVNVISELTNENTILNFAEIVKVKNHDSLKAHINESIQTNTDTSNEIMENQNCETKEQIYDSNSEEYDNNSKEINETVTSINNCVEPNPDQKYTARASTDISSDNDENISVVDDVISEQINENEISNDTELVMSNNSVPDFIQVDHDEYLLAENCAISSMCPRKKKIMNNILNVNEVDNEILPEHKKIEDSNPFSQFCFVNNNVFNVNHIDYKIQTDNLKSDLQFNEGSTEHLRTQCGDLSAPQHTSMILGYDSEDFMRAGVITVKDEQCCVVLERNGKIYSERGNSIEDVLCNVVPCSPLSDTDEHTQDYELVACDNYNNNSNDGVTESIDNFSGVDIQISSSEGDENANSITHTHKLSFLQEESMCDSETEESPHCNVDSRDPCLQGVDDSPVMLELPTIPNENNFCQASNFETNNIGIQYEDCWINDVACLETVVSEDITDVTGDEILDYDDCSNGSKEDEKELQVIDHEGNSVSTEESVEKEVKTLYVRIKLVSKVESENSNHDSCTVIEQRRPIMSEEPLIQIGDAVDINVPVQKKNGNMGEDNIRSENMTYVKNLSAEKRKSLKVSKYCSNSDDDAAEITRKKDDQVENYNKLRDKSIHNPAARGRVVSNVSYNYNTDTTHTGSKLITKAAMKYIPPIVDSQHNFKVQLPLSKENLLRLKIMKIKFEEATAKPKMRWQASFSETASTSSGRTSTNTTIPKKSKPKFEDVLKKIDHMQINSLSKPKVKKGDLDPSVPKVIIKKNEHGAHYTANVKRKRARSPDLTGRRWQPWVHIEKNRLIEKMVSRRKFYAVFCHSSNKYIIPRRERRESKDPRRDPEIVGSKPLKCTIKLNTDNGGGHAVLAPANVSVHTSHSSLHHSKPILTISNYKKNE